MPICMSLPSLGAVCSFFPSGLTVAPDYKLPISNNATCGMLREYVDTLPFDDPT